MNLQAAPAYWHGFRQHAARICGAACLYNMRQHLKVRSACCNTTLIRGRRGDVVACPLVWCGVSALSSACTGSRSGKYPVALLLADTYAKAVQGRVQARTTGLEYGLLARPASKKSILQFSVWQGQQGLAFVWMQLAGQLGGIGQRTQLFQINANCGSAAQRYPHHVGTVADGKIHVCLRAKWFAVGAAGKRGAGALAGGGAKHTPCKGPACQMTHGVSHLHKTAGLVLLMFCGKGHALVGPVGHALKV